MPSFQQIWQHGLLWNSVGDWVFALLVFLVVLTTLPLVKRFVAARRRRWAQAGLEMPLAIELTARLIEKTSRLFLLALALYCAFEQLSFPAESPAAHRIEHGVGIAITLIFWYQAGRWATAALRVMIDRRRRTAGAYDAVLTGSVEIILFVAGIVIWGMALLLALDNLGVAIRPLLAGLGIGGIAVALAVQAVLGDLLASMSIALDKPFVIGDLLNVDTLTGTVEYIGVKSTRLRSLSGEQIVMSNADILKSRIRNYGRMRERQVSFELPVHQDTAPELLRAIPEAISTLIAATPRARFMRCNLTSISETALRFEIVYRVLAPEQAVYGEVHNAVLLGLLTRLREMGVQFPTPAQTPMPPRLAAAPLPAAASAVPAAP